MVFRSWYLAGQIALMDGGRSLPESAVRPLPSVVDTVLSDLPGATGKSH